MNRVKSGVVLFVLFFIPAFLHAGGGSETNSCKTKYPVVLAHGMGASAEILGIVDYWWGIEDALEGEGCDVYITSVNGMDGTINKAIEFKRQVLEILEITGKEKVNIIGHSHGTVYSRYAIANLGLGPYVASHSSLAGPHRGSSVATLFENLPSWLAGDVLNFVYAFVFGDTNPDAQQNFSDLTPYYMTGVFNPNTPDFKGIYYQSWAAKAKTFCPSVILEPTWLYLLAAEGANDGLVSVESAKWGTFRGVEDAAWYSTGCDHLNVVGQLFGFTPGFDAPEFMISAVSDLKDRGY